MVLKTWKMANEMKPDKWLSRLNDQNNSSFSKNKIVYLNCCHQEYKLNKVY